MVTILDQMRNDYWRVVSKSTGATGLAPVDNLKIGFICDICNKGYELLADL